jgi:hypothetical protein
LLKHKLDLIAKDADCLVEMASNNELLAPFREAWGALTPADGKSHMA